MKSADSLWPFALTVGTSDHPKDGACLMSVVSWLVYGDLSDQPACVSEVVGEVARHVNDLLPDYRRQPLKSYIARLIDTSDGDSTERARLRFVHQYIIEELFPLGLAAAGLDFLIPVLRRVAPNHVVRLKPFVDEMGDKMDYNVALDSVPQSGDPNDGAMAKGWLRAAEENGIPAAFVIHDGKIAWIGHPMAMDEPLAKITAGEWSPSEMAKKRLVEKTKERKATLVRAKVLSGARTAVPLVCAAAVVPPTPRVTPVNDVAVVPV